MFYGLNCKRVLTGSNHKKSHIHYRIQTINAFRAAHHNALKEAEDVAHYEIGTEITLDGEQIEVNFWRITASSLYGILVLLAQRMHKFGDLAWHSTQPFTEFQPVVRESFTLPIVSQEH